LAVGAGAGGEAGDALELGGAAEGFGVGAAEEQEVGEELAGGDAFVEVGGDQVGLHAVAGGEEAVLVEDLGWDASVVGRGALGVVDRHLLGFLGVAREAALHDRGLPARRCEQVGPQVDAARRRPGRPRSGG
jgi:hypothetical protein